VPGAGDSGRATGARATLSGNARIGAPRFGAGTRRHGELVRLCRSCDQFPAPYLARPRGGDMDISKAPITTLR
jgi:hypothetical protein